MASELLSPPSRALDANANPYSGATWTFYATGGTTPQAVYADAALNTSLGSVVTADSGGKFVPIYFNSALVYRGVCKNSDGSVTLHDIDPINNSWFASLAAQGGSALVGFLQAGTGAVARTVQAKLRDTVSVFDFIPVAQQAAIVAGTSTYDCTSNIHAAIDYVDGTGQALHFPGGQYYVGEVTVDGSNYALETSSGVTFKQKPGLTGDAGLHPILNFDRCENVSLGDARFIGNIATDADEYSHAVALQGVSNVTLGRLYGTNIRGDVLYVSGTTLEPTYGVICAGVSGTNVYRNLLAMAGGEAIVGYVLNDGPVGYRDWLVEPNSGGFYQSSSLHVGMTRGGCCAVVSADTALQNGRVSVDLLDLDWSLIQATTPAYPSAPGTNGIGLAVSDVRSFHVGLLKLRNYKSYPVSLAARWDSIRIDDLDVSNCDQTETTFNSIVVQQGTVGDGLLDIGYVKCAHYNNTKWLVRSNTAGLKVRIGGGVISGGLLSVNCVLDVTGLAVDAGSASGAAANIITSGSLSRINNLSLTNAGSATLLYGSSNCTLNGVTGTVGTLVTAASNGNMVNASVINGSDVQGQVVSSDAPATVTAAATITLPLDRNTVVITGNTNITSITADPYNIRRVVTLQFTGTPTVTDGGNLALAGNFVATADDTLTLRGDGSNWNEVSRSAN